MIGETEEKIIQNTRGGLGIFIWMLPLLLLLGIRSMVFIYMVPVLLLLGMIRRMVRCREAKKHFKKYEDIIRVRFF